MAFANTEPSYLWTVEEIKTLFVVTALSALASCMKCQNVLRERTQCVGHVSNVHFETRPQKSNAMAQSMASGMIQIAVLIARGKR